MYRFWGLKILLVALVAGLCSSQDCAFPTTSQLEEVISEIIPIGDGSVTTPTVNLADFHVVCLAYGEEENLFRFISVVVNYTCTGNSRCDAVEGLEQIEAGCLNGNWSDNVQGHTDNIRSMTTEASFTTTPREDCSFCFSTEIANTISTISTDPVTHCVDCHPSCEGLRRCSGIRAGDCCNFYNNSECVVECPSPFVRPNSNNTCDCPLGRYGYNCSGIIVCNQTDLGPFENGNVMVTDGIITLDSVATFSFDSVATYSCDPGNYLDGDATRRCLGNGTWSGTIPSCVFVECGPLNIPENGKVDVKETFLGSMANYTCDPGYTLMGDAMRTCLRDGTWSGNVSICTGCKVPNCAICDTIDTCKECLSFYELSDNICKCPVKGCDVCDKDGTKCDQCENNGRFDESQSACITGGDDEGDDEGDGGLSPGAIAGIIIALIVLAILLAIAIALISYFAKRYWDKIHLKKTSLEAPKGDFRDNQLYVGPEELADDVDRGVTTPAGESDGISPSNGAVDCNGSE